MQINTEAREVFSSDIRRDIDELIDVVSMAMTAQTTVDEIKKKIESGNYSGTDLENLNKWYDAAKKQLDYANQRLHFQIPGLSGHREPGDYGSGRTRGTCGNDEDPYERAAVYV